MNLKLIRKIIFSSVIILSLGCFGKNGENTKVNGRTENKENDWKKDQLKGKVKSFKESYFEAIDYFGEIKKGKRINQFSFSNNNFQRVYNINGYLIETNYYNINDGSLSYKSIYKYDNFNNLTESSGYSADGVLVHKNIYRYSKKGVQSIERSINYEKDGKQYRDVVSKYDQNYNQIEYKSFTSEGRLFVHHQYTYDQYDNKIEKKSFSGEKLTSHHSFKYDSKGNEIEMKDLLISDNTFTDEYGNEYKTDSSAPATYYTKYDDHGNRIEIKSYQDEKLSSHTTYKYNKNKQMTEWVEHFNDSAVRRIYTYDDYNNLIKLQYIQDKNYDPYNSEHIIEYVYDKNKNWIKKTEFSDGKAKFITEREIKYYE